MKRILPFALLTVVATACTVAPTVTPPPSTPTLHAIVETPEGRVGVARIGATIRLYVVDDTGTHVLTQADESGQTPTVHLLSFGGQTGRVGNSYVFGSAPAGTQRVSIADGPVVGMSVERGLYVVVLQALDLGPDELRWTFLDGDGTAIQQGAGLRS